MKLIFRFLIIIFLILGFNYQVRADDWFDYQWSKTVGSTLLSRGQTVQLTIFWESDESDHSFTTRAIPDEGWSGQLMYASTHPGPLTGIHTGSTNSADLIDATIDLPKNCLVGQRLTNSTDSSYGLITANDESSVEAILANGTNNFWTDGDSYSIGGPTGTMITPTISYDPVLSSSCGALSVDLMGGELANRSATVMEYAEPYIPYLLTYGPKTFAVTGNSVNSGGGMVMFYFLVK